MRIDNLIKLCEKIGNNVLFVQGAGGNISVKNKDTLMVKASGQRLSEASKKNKKDIGIELHIGRNRIVRRIFNHLGYKVLKLDRVFFGGLTKKDLPRKKFRFLSKKEVGLLKRL